MPVALALLMSIELELETPISDDDLDLNFTVQTLTNNTLMWLCEPDTPSQLSNTPSLPC